MGEFKGTKGPWLKEVIKGNIMVTGGKIYPKRPDFNQMSIKVGYISEDDCGNSKCCCVEEHANAQLIASAPELLAMVVDHRKRISELRDIMEEQHSMWSHHRQMFNDLLNESEELITKAIG